MRKFTGKSHTQHINDWGEVVQDVRTWTLEFVMEQMEDRGHVTTLDAIDHVAWKLGLKYNDPPRKITWYKIWNYWLRPRRWRESQVTRVNRIVKQAYLPAITQQLYQSNPFMDRLKQRQEKGND